MQMFVLKRFYFVLPKRITKTYGTDFPKVKYK